MKVQQDLEEIWENDIMTNFSHHWDYRNHCPKRKQIVLDIENEAHKQLMRSNNVAKKKNKKVSGCFYKKGSGCSKKEHEFDSIFD